MSITLEELQVVLEANNKQFRQQMEASNKSLSDATKSMAQAVGKFADEGSKKTSFFQQTMATMAGFVGGQMLIGAFNSVKDAAIGFFTSGIDSAKGFQQSLNSLNSALASTGIFSKETSQGMVAFAAEMQKTTRFSDDMILKNAALIQSMGRLDAEGLKRATKAAADLSAGLGIDLEAATRLVGKAAAGEVSSFKRYGIAIEEGKTKTETFTNALKALEGRFGGRAAQDAKTFAGAIDILSNAWDDVKKVMGFVFVENQAIINVMAAVGQVIQQLGGVVSEHQNAWKEMIGNVMTMVIAFVQGPIKLLDDTLKFFGKKTILGDVVDALEKMGEASALGTQQMANGMAAAIEPINVMKNSVMELSRAEQERAEKGRESALSLIQSMWEDSAVRNDIRAQELQTELEQIQAAENAKKITQEQSLMAQKAVKDKFAADDRKRELEKLKFETDTKKAHLDMVSNFANLVTAVSGQQSKAMFLISKGAAVAQAFINAKLASLQALASPPGPPATVPISKAILASGMASAGAIAATAIRGLQHGLTEVPRGGGRDSFGPVMLDGGERVVDRGTNSDLKSAIAMILSGQGGGNITVEISPKDGFMDFLEAKLYERQRLNMARA
jgi:hypothetical protein